jgi:hypothetical protein
MTYRTQKRNPNKRLTAHESEPEGVLQVLYINAENSERDSSEFTSVRSEA